MRQRQGEPKANVQLARQARREQTPAERAMWEMVRDHRCGVHFRRQAVRRPFRLDFYCARLRLAVEVDGSIHDEPDVERHDAARQAVLEHDRRIRFLRVTNDDVMKRFQETRQRLLAALQEAQEPMTPAARTHSPNVNGPSPILMGEGWRSRGGGQ